MQLFQRGDSVVMLPSYGRPMADLICLLKGGGALRSHACVRSMDPVHSAMRAIKNETVKRINVEGFFENATWR